MNRHLYFIGIGNMGQAILNGLKKDLEWSKAKITCVKKHAETAHLPNEIEVLTGLQLLTEKIENSIVLLCVKPQIFQEISADIKKIIGESNIIISVMAGLSLEFIADSLSINSKDVIRTMPNLPCSIGLGMSTIYHKPDCPINNVSLCQSILKCCGEILVVQSENQIDQSTAISGSGPGYFFLFAEAMINKAISMGFSRNEARSLVGQTLVGASEVLLKNDGDATLMRKKVTSKNGTTEAAISLFNSRDFSEIIDQAMEQAYLRAAEISQSSNGISAET